MAKPSNQVTEAIENVNGVQENPQTGGSPLTIVRAKVSTSVTDLFKKVVEDTGVEYGVLLEMAMSSLLVMSVADKRAWYEAVLKVRSENTFK